MDPAIEGLTRTILDGRWEPYLKACRLAGIAAPMLVWDPDAFAIVEPRLIALRATWEALRTDPGWPDRLERLARDYRDILMIVTRRDDDVFVYDHYGAGVAAVTGRSLAGLTTRDAPSAVAPFFEASYHAVLARGAPLLTLHRPARRVEIARWLRLILPPPRPEPVDRLLVGICPIRS